MSPYQRTLQMYYPFISSKSCAKCCFSKTLHETAGRSTGSHRDDDLAQLLMIRFHEPMGFLDLAQREGSGNGRLELAGGQVFVDELDGARESFLVRGRPRAA